MTSGLYDEPDWNEIDRLGEADEKGEPIRVQTGMFGYRCRTKECSNEPRPGIPWPNVCSVKSSKLQHRCIPFVVSPEMSI